MKFFICMLVVACTPAVAPARMSSRAVAASTVRAPMVDFDGDGLADLAFPGTDEPADGEGEAYEVIALYLGKDRGTLSRLVRIGTRATRTDRTVAGYAERIGAVGDLDGDGKTDLAVLWDRSGQQSLRLLHGTRDGVSDTFYQAMELPVVDDAQWYNLAPRAAGDVDGDGKPDAVIGYGLFRGIGDGKLAAPELVGRSATLVPIGDLDRDGAADLVSLSWSTGQASLIRGGRRLSTPTALHMTRFATAADLDGDGVRELVGIDGPRVVAYHWNAGALVAEPGVTPKLALFHPAPHETMFGGVTPDYAGTIWEVAGFGADLVASASTSTTGNICNLECYGPTGFVLSTIRAGVEVAQRAASDRPHLLSPGDVDGDGNPDVVLETGGQIVVRRSAGGETTIAREISASPRRVEIETSHAALDP